VIGKIGFIGKPKSELPHKLLSTCEEVNSSLAYDEFWTPSLVIEEFLTPELLPPAALF
jgi:hypothetical protein